MQDPDPGGISQAHSTRNAQHRIRKNKSPGRTLRFFCQTLSLENIAQGGSYITTGKAGGLLGERLSSANGEGADKTESRPRRPY
ncbi:MAG: hypothetical protein Q8O45_11060, partial [Desulfurivibrionaceae bacterium]|nr:hypothetical protein [Desulfurivibrionaceae bacterium]